MPIAWVHLDGSVWLTTIAQEVLDREQRQGESTDQTVLRVAEEIIKPKLPGVAAITPKLIRTRDIPTSRVNRRRWRYKNITNPRVEDDPTVP